MALTAPSGLDAAAARCGERNHSLSLEVVCLHEGVDNSRASVPPLSIPVKRGNGLSQRGRYPWLRPAPYQGTSNVKSAAIIITVFFIIVMQLNPNLGKNYQNYGICFLISTSRSMLTNSTCLHELFFFSIAWATINLPRPFLPFSSRRGYNRHR